MAYLVWILKVQILLHAVMLTSEAAELTKGADYNAISSFLKQFIKPFLRATHVGPIKINTSMVPATSVNIDQVIRKKVTKLKPLLEDNDNITETDDYLTLRGNEETTVIEFLPNKIRKAANVTGPAVLKSVFENDPFQSSINKYKVLRAQIHKALDDESVSKQTKTLIINTLDDMLAQMIESQCTWTNQRRHVGKNNNTDAIWRLQNLSKNQWTALRRQYMKYLAQKHKKNSALLNEINHFFTSLMNETDNLTDRYKIKCQLVPKNNNFKKQEIILRGQLDSQAKCPNFKLCSDELRDFLTDFYSYLNDTAVSVFTNYAEMYVRDVNVNFGIDSKVVVTDINSLGDMAEKKVTRIFKNKLRNFELALNKNKYDNIKHITNFLSDTIGEVKRVVKNNLIQELGKMKTKLFLTIKEDLIVNLEVDLDNLERHYIDTFCGKFMFCNGGYSARRREGTWTFRPKNNNEMYVKVQLSLDDHMKNVVLQTGFLQMMENTNNVKYKIKKKNRIAVRESAVRINVTRTTPHIEVIPMTHAYKEHKKHHGKNKHHKTTTESDKTNSIERRNGIIQT